jgi:hypothetical protein
MSHNWDEARKNTGEPESHHSPPPGERGIHGSYVMAIFLACGFLMTLGWGGITIILVSVAKIGLSGLTPKERMSDDPVRESRNSEDVATSTSDLCPLVQTRKPRMKALRIRDERRRMK